MYRATASSVALPTPSCSPENMFSGIESTKKNIAPTAVIRTIALSFTSTHLIGDEFHNIFTAMKMAIPAVPPNMRERIIIPNLVICDTS